jgi:hypothetical protein
MITEVKLNKTKKIKKNGKRKHIKAGLKKTFTKKNLLKNEKENENKNKKNKKDHNEINKDDKDDKDDKYNKSKNNLQKGGNTNLQGKENFEVKRLDDIDYSQFSLTKYLNANIDWGMAPGPPPLDCCIM